MSRLSPLYILLTLLLLLTGANGDSQNDEERLEILIPISREVCNNSNRTKICSCENIDGRFTINCRCNNKEMIVNLTGSNADKLPQGALFRVKECTMINVHKNSLQAVTSPFTLQLTNANEINLEEHAFRLSDELSSKSDIEINLEFMGSNLPILPPKVFPSTLSSVVFNRCQIGQFRPDSFSLLFLSKIIIQESTIAEIEPAAFKSSTYIETWVVTGSKIDLLQTNAIKASISSMTWRNSQIGIIESSPFTGIVANLTIENSQINQVNKAGIAVKDWSQLTLINNTFGAVRSRGIDFGEHSGSGTARILGNSWRRVESDFVITGGRGGGGLLVTIRDNTFEDLCDCAGGNRLARLLSLNGSSVQFHDELYNNSRCFIGERSARCLEQNDTYLPYENLSSLCESHVFLCIKELDDVSATPQVVDQIQLVFFTFGAILGSISLVMLIILCVILSVRKKGPHPPKKKMVGGVECTESEEEHPTNSNNTMSIELEKCLGTPSTLTMSPDEEFTSDFLKQIENKIQRPESFWEGVEAIDHLYDVIKVRELAASNRTTPSEPQVSSPPDVTMCSTFASPNLTSPINPPPPPPINQVTGQRYAQIRPRRKTAPICEYGNPSDQSVHTYSTPTLLRDNVTRSLAVDAPVICEYRDPRDAQTHVYAELAEIRKNNAAATPHSVSSSRIVTMPRITSTSTVQMKQRPLPSIPNCLTLK